MRRIVIFILCLAAFSNVFCQQNTEYLGCLKKFCEVTNTYNTLEDEINAWSKYRDYCSPDGSYEERYASIYFKYGKHKECLEYLLAESKKYKQYEIPKRMLNALGEIYLNLHNTDEARKIGNNLAKRYYDWEGGYSLLGRCCINDGDFEKARYYFLKSIKKDEGSSELNFSNLIKIDLYLSRYEEIINISNFTEQAGLDLAHQGNETGLCIAIAMIETGRHDDGRKLMLVQSKLDPSIAEHTGYKEAIRTYEKATGKPFNGQ